jgi:hypothetical protein
MSKRAQTQTKQSNPASFTPALNGMLQRKCASCGNHTIAGGQCHECGKKTLQTKLRVNEPGDVYEQEADRIADQVMAAPAHSTVSGVPPRIQRFSAQSNGRMDAAPASVDQALASPGRPLEPALRQDMEPRFGHDFSRVRVHSGAAAEQSAQGVNAKAYTMGRNIVFGTGGFAPSTHEGRRLLAHELTHVVQQSEANPVVGGGSADSGVTVAQRSPSPEIMRSLLLDSTFQICHRMLEMERSFAITEGGLKVTTVAQWQPSEEWQGTREELQCGNPEFSISLIRDDPIFDTKFGTCTFPMEGPTSYMGAPSTKQWTKLSEDDDWYLQIWTLNTNPNCCLEGSIKVEQERGLSGQSCTKLPPGPLEILHGALGAAGMLPFLGAFPDTIDAAIYAIEGKWSEAGLSALAVLPIFGDAPKGASLIDKAGKEAVRVSGDTVERIGKDKIAKELGDTRTVVKKISDPELKQAMNRFARDNKINPRQFEAEVVELNKNASDPSKVTRPKKKPGDNRDYDAEMKTSQYNPELKRAEDHRYDRINGTRSWCRFSDPPGACNAAVGPNLNTEVDTTLAKMEGKPAVTVAPRSRGYAVEDMHMPMLENQGYKRLPDWFKTHDAIRGGTSRFVTENGKRIQVIQRPDAISIKSTYITEPTELTKKVTADLDRLRGRFEYTRGNVRVEGVRNRQLDLIFEEGSRITAETVRTIEQLKKTAGNVTIKWYVIHSGRKFPGPDFLRDIAKTLEDL